MNKLVGHVFPFPLEELCPLCGSGGGGGGGHTSAIGITHTHRQDTTQNRTGQNRTEHYKSRTQENIDTSKFEVVSCGSGSWWWWWWGSRSNSQVLFPFSLLDLFWRLLLLPQLLQERRLVTDTHTHTTTLVCFVSAACRRYV